MVRCVLVKRVGELCGEGQVKDGVGQVMDGVGMNRWSGIIRGVCKVSEVGSGSGGMEDREPEDNALETASS